MKRNYVFMLLGLFILGLLVGGCSKETKQADGEKFTETNKYETDAGPNNNQKEEDKGIPEVQEGSPDWVMLQIEKAVEDNDIDSFMHYQNKENPIFYKEQKRWIEEAIFKKKQGYKLSVDVSNFMKEDDTKGTVFFKVTMAFTGAETMSNLVSYQMIKAGDSWVLNDVPFEKITSESGIITVYYKKGEEEPANKTLTDATDIVDYYAKMFNWKPEPISIKIYPTNSEVSATVPWMMLGGWNEMGESLKLTTNTSSQIFKYLAHELTHKMVSDITKDNATIYIQEGFASYLGVTITRGSDGKISYDHQKAFENSKKALEASKSIKTIGELGKIDYSDPEASMYRDGSLLSTYLIETHGMDSFQEMLRYLSKFEYIDKRSEHKMDIVHPLTVEAIEKVYGSAEKVSSDMKNYYSK